MAHVLEEIINNQELNEWLEPQILDLQNLKRLRQEFLDATPFQHLFIDDFLQEDKLDAVTVELSNQDFEFKESDLFSFYQTPDVEKLTSPILLSFKDLLRSPPFVRLMEFLTETELSDDVDCLGNIYAATDHLLCHDDELQKRKIAYIFYLTDLDVETGGALHLFDAEGGQPHQIVKKIYPQQNRLAFFKVTRESFHEVGEVVAEDIYRVSISGWFNND